MVTTTSLQLGIAAGFLVMIGLRLFGPHALAAMGVLPTSDIFPHAITYLNTRCLSAPFFLLITVAEGALRGYGDTKIPLLASTATAATMVALEPFLMFILGWKIRGAAAAMGISQVAGAAVYAYFLRRRLGQVAKSTGDASNAVESTAEDNATLTKGKILLAIAKANFIMIIKQGSLLFTWAYATKMATKLGAEQVAAHQVALSFWMVFAYVLDAVSVGAQVLLSKARKNNDEMRSVSRYMISVAAVQGLLITLVIAVLSPYLPICTCFLHKGPSCDCTAPDFAACNIYATNLDFSDVCNGGSGCRRESVFASWHRHSSQHLGCCNPYAQRRKCIRNMDRRSSGHVCRSSNCRDTRRSQCKFVASEAAVTCSTTEIPSRISQ